MSDQITKMEFGKWEKPFIFIDDIAHIDSGFAVAFVFASASSDRFSYSSYTSPSLLIESIAQLSSRLIEYVSNGSGIGIILSLQDIIMLPTPKEAFYATVCVRMIRSEFPKFETRGVVYISNRAVCSATVVIMAGKK